MGDRIVVLKDGHVQQIAPPLELYERPANQFVAGFIGSPSMNFVEGTLENGAFESSMTDRLAVNGTEATSRDVTLGVRPEDLFVSATAPESKPTSVIGSYTIDVLEPMGNEVVMYASQGGTQLVARVEPQTLPSPGETVQLAADVSKLHLFETGSGRALRG